MRDGQFYTLSQDGGHPGGAFADPSLVIPKQGDVGPLGGAEGLVVGGTGKYKNAGGPDSTRLKLETIGGFFADDDELFFRFREVEDRVGLVSGWIPCMALDGVAAAESRSGAAQVSRR